MTTSIRRKLQQGRTPEEIVQELVAGGLGQVSAQRFVDRAIAEDASAPPPPPLPDAPGPAAAAPGDSLDQFIQTKSAETQVENAKTGSKALWVASMLMCSGVAITGISYIMADPGERFTLMWGPVAFGFLLWGKTVLQGFGNARTFAWFSAAGSAATPIVLAVILFGFAIANGPTEEELLRMQIADAIENAADAPHAGAQTVANRATPADQPEVFRLLNQFEESESESVQCEAAAKLSRMTGDDAVDAVDGLMEHYEVASERVQTCIKDTVSKLDPEVQFPAR